MKRMRDKLTGKSQTAKGFCRVPAGLFYGRHHPFFLFPRIDLIRFDS
jgi:hypothetical protein